MVTGRVDNSTGNETGVTVNGIVANVYDGQFFVNHVPLEDEQSTIITAAATDTAGNTQTASISVNKDITGHYITLTANIESGITPFESTLRVDGSFSIEESSVYGSGPGAIEWPETGTEDYLVQMTVPGVYTFSASVPGPDSIIYQDSIVIIVLDKTQLDALLKGKWDAMKTALANQDVNTALNYFTYEAQQHYYNLFTALQTDLPQIAQEMQEIELIRLKNNSAKYRIRRDELYGGQTETITYYIYFMVDENGIWRIDWY